MAAVFLLPVHSLVTQVLVIGSKAFLRGNISRRRAAASVAVATVLTLTAALLVCVFAIGRLEDKTSTTVCVGIALVMQACIVMGLQLDVVRAMPEAEPPAVESAGAGLAAPKP